jgi:hypothetical protein
MRLQTSWFEPLIHPIEKGHRLHMGRLREKVPRLHQPQVIAPRTKNLQIPRKGRRLAVSIYQEWINCEDQSFPLNTTVNSFKS